MTGDYVKKHVDTSSDQHRTLSCSLILNDDYEVFVYDLVPLNKAHRLKDFKTNLNFHYQEGDLRDKEKIKEW